jgi:hypothetical protein
MKISAKLAFNNEKLAMINSKSNANFEMLIFQFAMGL